jgi:hypothetical protein
MSFLDQTVREWMNNHSDCRFRKYTDRITIGALTLREVAEAASNVQEVIDSFCTIELMKVVIAKTLWREIKNSSLSQSEYKMDG